METSLDRLADIANVARDLVAEILDSAAVRALSDADLVRATQLAGSMLRASEAALIELGAEVEARSQSAAREERLTVRFGCANANELLQRATLAAPTTAAKWLRAGAAVRGVSNVMTGEVLPPVLPALRGALAEGSVGVDGVLAISRPLLEARHAAHPEDFAAADRNLAASARGADAESETCAGIPATADTLRAMAIVWATALDQDGAEPLEQRAMKNRALSIGLVRDGLVPINGRLLPEVAAQLRWIADATGNPRVSGVRFVDSGNSELPTEEELLERDRRTAAQKFHDALATALVVAAASEQLPTIGGAAPTLVVHVAERDFVAGSGWASVGETPVATSVARHVACSGAVQRVTTTREGRTIAIGSEERVFNRHQRRAIALRDGGCVIPGCTVSAAWCEVHHVTEHANGGPTHTDNGVLLCWHHHRFLDHHGWAIRMAGGTPEIKAPHWLDPHGQWRKPRRPSSIARTIRRT